MIEIEIEMKWYIFQSVQQLRQIATLKRKLRRERGLLNASLFPDADGSLAQALPDGQLEEEEREALGEEHDPVGDQEGT